MLEKKDEDEMNVILAEIVEEMKELLKEELYKIVLYGSCARGDYDSESDIDIMIIMNCGKDKILRYRKQVSKVASRIGLKNDIEVSMLLRDKDTFEQNESIIPFYQNIQKEGVALYG